MASWILLVVAAQFLYAIAVIIDKYVVTTPTLPRPAVYAFYVSLLSLVGLVVVPFGDVTLPSSENALYALLSGATYIFGILLLFSSLSRAEASDVIPVVGAASAVVTFFMQLYFFEEPLPAQFLLGFVLLVVGTMFISHYRFKWRGLLMALFSGVFLGASTMFVKLVFDDMTFASGFFWTRMANVLGGLALLLWPPIFYAVTQHEREPAKRAGWLIILNKSISGGAFLLILFAIKDGIVPIINAMQGLQFVFLLIFASGCSLWMPLCFSDGKGVEKMTQKIIATVFIIAGLVVLYDGVEYFFSFISNVNV